MDERRIRDFWFASGTPTYLIKMIQLFHTDITKIDFTQAAATTFDAPTETMTNIIPLLYQSGYITIKDYNETLNLYTLGIPNKEVRTGLFQSLYPYYVAPDVIERDMTVAAFYQALLNDDMEDMLAQMQTFFESIPNDLDNKTEKHFQTVFYIMIKLMGQYIQTEVRSATGRADAVLYMPDTIYVIEMKMNGTVADALQQIDTKGYLLPYKRDKRRLMKVGINFDTEKRTLSDWKVVEG